VIHIVSRRDAHINFFWFWTHFLQSINSIITVDGKINGKINGKISSILDVLKYNPTATIPDLTEVTGKSLRTISRELKEYQDAGLLEREGSRKNGRWIAK
jgi:predicted HTH transcriptional regulator